MSNLVDRAEAGFPERYRVEREIGRGGVGRAFPAHDPALDRPVAFGVRLHRMRGRWMVSKRVSLALWCCLAVAGCGDSTGPPAPVASIAITPASSTLGVGKTLQLTAVPRDAAGHALDRSLSWTSSNAAVAGVSATGLVTGVAVGGPVLISATADSAADTAAITVALPAVASVTVWLATSTLEVGERAQARLVLRDADGVELTFRAVEWSSSDTAIATVSGSGMVTAVAAGGPVSITATSEGVAGGVWLTVVLAPVGGVTVGLAAPTLTPGQRTQATVQLWGTSGQPVFGWPITWTSSDTAVARVSGAGEVSAVSVGQAAVFATAGGVTGSVGITVTTPDQVLDTAVGTMLQEVPDVIAWALASIDTTSSSAWVQAKVAMLQSPTLASDIVDGQFHAGTLAASLSGGSVPVVAIFPLDTMRAGAADAVSLLATALPILERVFDRPLFLGWDGFVRVWYGFLIGNGGGGGTIQTEDRGTYEARVPSQNVPHEAILYHELAHSYIGHESLTQYLEVHLYNRVRTTSTELDTWTYLRGGYTPLADGHEGVHLLLDVHYLIGWEAMARAYRRIHTLRPPYGVPLSDECKQVFVDEAPAPLREQVAAIVARIVY